MRLSPTEFIIKVKYYCVVNTNLSFSHLHNLVKRESAGTSAVICVTPSGVLYAPD